MNICAQMEDLVILCVYMRVCSGGKKGGIGGVRDGDGGVGWEKNT